MPQTTKTITFSLSRYMEENEWQQLLRYGEQRTREQQINPEDVSRLVEEYRAEIGSSRP